MQKCDGCGMRIWSTDQGICPKCFPEENRAVYGIKPKAVEVMAVNVPYQKPVVDPLPEYADPDKTLSAVTKFYILKVYEEENKHKTNAAKKLGITAKTLYNHLYKYKVI